AIVESSSTVAPQAARRAAAVYTLKDYIVHTHAKDGICHVPGMAEYVYHVTPLPEVLEEKFKGQRFFDEVPLGHGQVPYPAYIKALDDIGYKGFLTIEREVGETPEKDIEEAIHFLRTLC
ncbi:MAG: TIM barrel protein, partial [Clostridia bacterium]|nr:TIM barrel protein [Clostridia bacterium]